MTNVIALGDPRQHAKAVRDRLWNRPAAKQSTELDIVSGYGMKQRRAEILRQQEEAKLAEVDFRKRRQIDDLIRAAVAEHAEAKRIAIELLDEEPTPTPVTIGKVLVAVSNYYGVPIIDIKAARRTPVVMMPRQVTMYLCREHTLCSFPQIGERLGKRDHTTVMHGYRKIKALVETDARLAADIDNIKWELGIR